MTLDEMMRAEDVITELIPEKEETAEKKDDAGENDAPAESTDRAIYLPPFYFSEAGTAKRLSAISREEGRVHINTDGLAQRIGRRTGMQDDEIQMQAILQAAGSKVLILTGGPGTGKTTTTLGIITAFREAGARILLAAPTGRAAKRLSEATGMEAKTIHRLLEVKPPEGYQKNEENPLEGDVLILDECSMIDILLMYNLLKAVPDTMTLIMVGDTDQLPSVGPGNVLRDIIDSGCFPVVRLTRIFRQAQKSRIIMNAHRINEGRMPDISNGRNSDFFFMDMEKQALKKGLDPENSTVLSEEAAQTITELVSENLPKYYKVPSAEIQVLAPMQRGTVGAANLNQMLQEKLNPEGQGLRRGGFLFKTNDKVMQIRNNYDKEVFNGDIGTVSSVSMEDRELAVTFDDRTVTYDVSELDELVLAYAATIHKSQGSEYPIVVMPVLMSHFVMLQRNLVYTGITRAKKILVLVGTKKALGYAVRNVTVTDRNTMLQDRLKKLMPQETQPPGSPAESAAHMTAGEKISHEEWLKQDLTLRLSKSKFRSRFHLSEGDRKYIREKGMDTVRRHAAEIVQRRLAPAEPKNDGSQTPMRGAPNGHPVFIAQHATATCCRGCLFKWHGIPKGRELTDKEQGYIVKVLMRWIQRQMQDI